MRNLTKVTIFIWFFLIVFEGLLRFVFSEMGVPALIYIKDMLLLSIFLVIFFYIIYRGLINKTLLIIFLFVFYGGIVGYFNNLNPLQVLLGFKIFLSFFVGFISVYVLKVEEKFFLKMFRFFVPIILLGVLLECFYPLPWKGFEYELLGFSIEGSRQWTTFGISRLSGFERASFETAILLYALSCLYLIISYNEKPELKVYIKLYDYIFLGLSFVGIILTTSKSAVLAYTIVILFLVLLKISDGVLKQVSKSTGTLFIKFLLASLFLYGIIPPLVALSAPAFVVGKLNSYNLNFLFASYIERIDLVWPKAIQLLSKNYMFLTGRGLGGIGIAQQYFEKEMYNPADNLYIYLFVDFGIIIFSILLVYLLVNLFYLRRGNKENIYFVTFCLILFSYGATLNVIESPVLMITLGILLGFSKKRQLRIRNG